MVHWDVLTVRHRSPRRLDVGLTLAPLGHGPGDPTFHRGADGTLWRTSLLRTGPVTQRFVPAGPHEVVVHLWGDGAREAAEQLPTLLGENPDDSGFAPPPQAHDAHRRAAGMRMARSGRVLEALVPAVLEQRVQTVTAHRAWRWLVRHTGTPAPGPVPADLRPGPPGGLGSGLRVVPDARTWARVPVWDWHRAGVDPGRARTVGDFHLPAAVGWALAGERTDDDGMLRLLAPYAPHRHRVVRLLMLDGRHRAPRRGARLPIADYRAF